MSWLVRLGLLPKPARAIPSHCLGGSPGIAVTLGPNQAASAHHQQHALHGGSGPSRCGY